MLEQRISPVKYLVIVNLKGIADVQSKKANSNSYHIARKLFTGVIITFIVFCGLLIYV